MEYKNTCHYQYKFRKKIKLEINLYESNLSTEKL